MLLQIILQPYFSCSEHTSILCNLKLVENFPGKDKLGIYMPDFLVTPALQPFRDFLKFAVQRNEWAWPSWNRIPTETASWNPSSFGQKASK